VDSIVLDASAVLAMLQDERGGERVAALLESDPGAVAICSVNLCEIVTRLVRSGVPHAIAAKAIEKLMRYVVAFDAGHAMRAAEMYRQTHEYGLSLGDRACLALAASLSASVWTTDAAWRKVKIGVEVELVRG
jgi:ribonuclease VapC